MASVGARVTAERLGKCARPRRERRDRFADGRAIRIGLHRWLGLCNAHGKQGNQTELQHETGRSDRFHEKPLLTRVQSSNDIGLRQCNGFRLKLPLNLT